ncbi:hypothetical protein ACLESO_02985 [Pyxidicoccus sp. 3LG]
MRGPRLSTVLTALLVAAGLALPGVAAFLLRQESPPSTEPTPNPSPATRTGSPAPSGAPPLRGSTEAPPPSESPSPTDTPATRVPTAAPASPRTSPVPRATEKTPNATEAPKLLARLDPSPAQPSPATRPSPNLREAELHAVLDDPNRPAEERSAAALALLDTYQVQIRTRSLARVAEQVFQQDLPAHGGRLPAEQAGWIWANALNTLDDDAKAIEVGQAFLRRFPQSALAPAVDTLVRSTTTHLAYEDRARKEMQSALKALEEELELKRARLESRGEPTTHLRRALAFEHCDKPAHAQVHDVSVVTCRAFIDTWATWTTPAERAQVRDAWASQVIALVRLRRYTEARERLAAFRAAAPEIERETIASEVVQSIPAGAEE